MTGLMHRLNTGLDLAVLHMREPLTRQIVLNQAEPTSLSASRSGSSSRSPNMLVDELLAALSW